MYPAAYEARGPKGEKLVPSADRTHLIDAATGQPWQFEQPDPEALHHGEYNVEDYKLLTSAGDDGYSDDETRAALGRADAATLVRAYTYFLDECRGRDANAIGNALYARHGFTDDDLQLVAEMRNPASPAARAALGLASIQTGYTGEVLATEVAHFPPDMETTNETAPAPLRYVQRAAADLPDHPLLAHIPVWQAHEPEFQSLKASIADRGVDYPVLIDSAGRVVDGRNRRNACSALGITVPVRTVDDGEVVGVILSALGNRRHVSKGAMAYLLAPLLKPAVEEARARQIACQKRGESGSPLSGRPAGTTVESLADGYGFGRSLLFQALELHEKFKIHPELKTQFEEGILSGDLGLGGALQAIAGKLSTEGKARVVRPPEVLIVRAVTDLRNRFEGWKTMPEDKRAEVASQFVASAPEWPAEIAAATAAAWRKAGLIS